jgi:hypothetical protein
MSADYPGLGLRAAGWLDMFLVVILIPFVRRERTLDAGSKMGRFTRQVAEMTIFPQRRLEDGPYRSCPPT